MLITLAHPPSVEAAFAFFGLASGAVAAPAIDVNPIVVDADELNRATIDDRYDVASVSFPALALASKRYVLLRHAAVFATSGGPAVLVRRADTGEPARLDGLHVGVSGYLSSEFLALRIYDGSFEFEVLPARTIPDAVISHRIDAGLVPSTSVLARHPRMLELGIDVAAWWHTRTGGLSLPISGVVVRRDFGPETRAALSRLVRESVAYAFAHPDLALAHARRFGEGGILSPFLLDYGSRGGEAINRFLREGFERGFLPATPAAECA